MTESPVSFPFSFLEKLRFPQLFLVLALLFIGDLLFPDLLFGVDEVLLGILTLMLGRLRKPEFARKSGAAGGAKPPEKNVTPPTDTTGSSASGSSRVPPPPPTGRS